MLCRKNRRISWYACIQRYCFFIVCMSLIACTSTFNQQAARSHHIPETTTSDKVLPSVIAEDQRTQKKEKVISKNEKVFVAGAEQFQALESEIFEAFEDTQNIDVQLFRDAYQQFEDELNTEQIEMQTWDRFIETPALDIPLVVYEPNIQNDASAAIMLIHSGHFVAGSHHGVDHAARLIAQQTQMKVITVGYRLSPEFKFPKPILDISAVAQWLLLNGDTWGIDASKLILVGEGVGADLALAATLELISIDVFPFKALVLLYGQYAPPSKVVHQDNASILLSDSILEWSYSQYLNNQKKQINDAYIYLLEADLTGLPPLYLVAADTKRSKEQTYRLAKNLLNDQQNYVVETWTQTPVGALMAAQLMPSVTYKLQKISSWIMTMTDVQ